MKKITVKKAFDSKLKTKNLRRPRKVSGAKKRSRNLAGTITKPKRNRFGTFLGVVFKNHTLIPQFEESINQTIDWFNHLIKHRGVEKGTKYFNDTRIYVIKRLLGLEAYPVKTLSLHKDGFPAAIASLKAFESNPDYLRIVYTILSLPRLACYSTGEIPTGSITKHPDRSALYKDEISSFKDALPSILKELKIKRGKDPKDIGKAIKLHQVSTKGPNSKSSDALVTSHLDSIAILKDVNVSYSIQNYLKCVDNLHIWEYINRLGDQYAKYDRQDLVCSRIAALPQPGNKQRVVALMDYFSQTLLLPLHDYLFKITDLVPNTYVFDQDKGRSLVKDFTADEEACPQSYDASAFTDRFPMELQEALLEVLFSKEYARCVRHLLTNRNFKISGTEKMVRYGAGQPMGAFSSFPLANLTHSLYVYWKLSSKGENPITDSAVVGDDVAFRHLNVGASAYVQGMKRLGVEFSELKGYNSLSKKVRVAEFCKRLYVNGSDISPISPKAASKATKDFKFLSTVADHLDDQSFTELLLQVPDRWRKEALELYSLPSYLLGINLKIDQDLPELTELNNQLNKYDRESVLLNLSIQETATFALEQITKRKSELNRIQKNLFKSQSAEVIATRLNEAQSDAALAHVYTSLSCNTMQLAGWFAEANDNNSDLELLASGGLLHPLGVVAAELLDFDEMRNYSSIVESLHSAPQEGQIPQGPVCRLLSVLDTDSIREKIGALKRLSIEKEVGLMPTALAVRASEQRDNRARMSYAIGKRVLNRIKQLD